MIRVQQNRRAPCSTFKVPNTAILLESGAAPDPSYTLEYDPGPAAAAAMGRDFDLRGAFKASSLWYYQAMARRAGFATERRFVEQFSYGNADVSGGLDTIRKPFWVDGTLRISANEQVEFLRRLYVGLPHSRLWAGVFQDGTRQAPPAAPSVP